MNEKETINQHITEIKRISQSIKKNINLMEICGGHTNVILKYGIREILPANIRLISGPGCPVCVSSQHDIDCIIELAKSGIPIATYGDMMRVPGSTDNLEDIKAKGAKIFEIYSTTELINLKKTYPDIVFFGIGFETTAPMTAFLLKNNICVYSVHKLIPPALHALIRGEIKIDGFIDPGHVSTITGLRQYRKIKIPQVISGFTAERILRAIRILVELIKNNKNIVINAYPEAVKEEGNEIAQELLKKYFYTADSEWRGLGMIPLSGLEVKNEKLNAKLKYKKIFNAVPLPKKSACRCGEILKGLIQPDECPLYRKTCTPENPKGACMVSAEGSCAIAYMYGK
ncbi:hydrogenase formation protein HypD [Candidatus Woesearchaeota archaeon]|nr:hydrogenase formation protein HypD [Candidatus Woesearchaeota archaeon]